MTQNCLNKMLIDHISRLIEINRDYMLSPSKEMRNHYKWFMDRVDDMYDKGWIDLETYSKAMMGIEYLIKFNKEKKSAKKKN